ncbi:MAG: hypothetical protein ACR2QF_15935 [Geminicoccaceae bacterium]
MIDLIDHYNNDPDTVPEGFETNFLTDIAERFKNEKSDMFVSPKMMNILRRIGSQRYGMNWDRYRDD